MNLGLAIEASAVIISALATMIVAAKKRMDLVGVYALAVVTSFGGGTLRDLLLDRRPFFWVARWEYLLIVFVMCVLFVYSRRLYEWSSTLVARADIIDALGLGLFTVSGTALAAHLEMPAVVCALLGVLTSTGGGVARDLIINEVPQLFQHGRLHATSALVGAVAYLVLTRLGMREATASVLAASLIVTVRLVALWMGTALPKPHWLQTGNYRVTKEESGGSCAISE
jgi:uncharacterized membrane protein YeiH